MATTTRSPFCPRPAPAAVSRRSTSPTGASLWATWICTSMRTRCSSHPSEPATAGRSSRSDAEGRDLRQVTPDEPDVDNYDPCYLPDGRIIFASTAVFAGVPCVGGGNTVANLYRMDADGRNIRQLCFDQDHNWCPTVMNDGRVLYSRWEYSDTPHYFTRLLFHMNPDGTGQMEYYGSNSYWPNSIFYARPIPGHPTKVVAVISGHHGVPRMGELVLFDPAKGRRESAGAVQRIPGYGKRSSRIIRDGLVDGSWPKFLHPYPLSEKYFLVSCSPPPNRPGASTWSTCSTTPCCCAKSRALPCSSRCPSGRRPRPPVIPDKVRPESRDAIGLSVGCLCRRGAGRACRAARSRNCASTSRTTRIRNMGGHINIGMDGPWDVRRILGTVPVEEDGSAIFRVPANTPIAVQPLDAEGKALQVMRSWFTAMPGETLSCVGCHESQNSTAARPRTWPRGSAPVGHHAVARAGARVQLRARSAAGAGPVLRRLPRRPAATGWPDHPGFHRQGEERLAQLHAVLSGAASVRAPPGAGERLPPPDAAGVSRRHQRTGADAAARAITTCSSTPRPGTG